MHERHLRPGRFLDGPVDDDFVAASPLHFLPGLDEDGACSSACAPASSCSPPDEGAHEDIGESWRVAHELGPAACRTGSTSWGPEWPHDWQTWRAMLPHYLDESLTC